MIQNPRKELLRLVAIVCAVAAILCINKIWFEEYKPRRIKVGIAKIIAVSPRVEEQEKRIYFVYDINSSTQKQDTSFQRMEAFSYDSLTRLVGKTAPVMYDANDHTYIWVLFTLSEYKRYKVEVTDSSVIY